MCGNHAFGEAAVTDFSVHRAAQDEIDAAFAIVSEYYEAARVVARDSREEFARLYFGKGAGVWLSAARGKMIGCIALRALPTFTAAGEVKRLYVKPAHRGKGIAAGLLEVLEGYAAECGYEWLYLDTTDEMVAAARFYERNGYQPCARYNDNPQATIFLCKELKIGTKVSGHRAQGQRGVS